MEKPQSLDSEWNVSRVAEEFKELLRRQKRVEKRHAETQDGESQ
jgi:hypothetical protein